ncbi:MAG: hypothetical protein PHC51_02585 [bacterium]|nr:hypothetical protein [bacterium]MDD2941832.1 hypothetical protein [bacterium]
MSNNLKVHNFGAVIRVVHGGKFGGMACVGGKAVKYLDADMVMRCSQAQNPGKPITKDGLIQAYALQLIIKFMERYQPEADLEKLSGWSRGDAYAVSKLRGTPFWMMVADTDSDKIEINTLTKAQYIDYCRKFDREMHKEKPFEGVLTLAA